MNKPVEYSERENRAAEPLFSVDAYPAENHRKKGNKRHELDNICEELLNMRRRIAKETMKNTVTYPCRVDNQFCCGDLCPANKHAGPRSNPDPVHNNSEYANQEGNKLFWNPLLVKHAESLSSRSSPSRPDNGAIGNLLGKGE